MEIEEHRIEGKPGWSAGRQILIGLRDNSMPTEMEDYLFDLNGYLILKNAITPEHVD